MKKLWLLILCAIGLSIVTSAQTDTNIITPQNAQDVVQVGQIGDGAIYQLAMSPTGQHFVVGGYMGVWIFDSANPQTPLHYLDGHDARIMAVSFSKDGRFIATSGEDGKFVVWDVQTGKPLFVSTEVMEATEASVRGVGFIRNDYLVSVTFYGDIFTWDLRQGELYTQVVDDNLRATSRIFAFSPNEDYLALGSVDGSIQLYWVIPEEFPNGGGIIGDGSLTSDIGFVYDLTFDSTGTRLAATSFDGDVVVWDMTTKTEILNVELDCVVGAVTFDSQQANRLMIGCDNNIHIYEMTRGEFITTIPAHVNTIFDLVYNPTNDRFISIDNEHIHIWEGAGTPHLVEELRLNFSNSIWSLSYVPINRAIVTVDNEVRQYDLTTGTYSVLMTSVSGGYSGHISTPDGDYVVAFSWDGGIDVLNVHTNEIEYHQDIEFVYEHFAISPNGMLLAFATDNESIELVDLTTGESRHIFRGHTDIPIALSFSPDANRLISCGWDLTPIVWDVTTGEMIYQFPSQEGTVNVCVYSPDGTKIIFATDSGAISVWDAVNFTLIQILDGHRYSVGVIAFSPDGQIIASGGEDATIMLWDVSTGKLLNTLTGHHGTVSGIAFSEDGTTLISGAYDGTIHLWGFGTR